MKISFEVRKNGKKITLDEEKKKIIDLYNKGIENINNIKKKISSKFIKK